MRIINLVENTEGPAGCTPAHGLSFYIETDRHRLLMDAGPGEVLVHNAEALGIDLSLVDTIVLSHGHYDHTDGLPYVHSTAPIYLRKSADGAFYSGSAQDGSLHYIGMHPAVGAMPRLNWVEGELRIDEDLFLFGDIAGRRSWPESNRKLTKRSGDTLIQDDFSHEQCLVIRENGKTVLLSGCAHNGILNILDRYHQLHHSAPDVVISGFHMKKSSEYTAGEEETIRTTARELTSWPCLFYTCHCTGLRAYAILKGIMGNQLQYMHCGDEIVL